MMGAGAEHRVSNEYQILNPTQLYPTHASQGVSRMKPSAANYNKPPVYRQETECRYGVSSFYVYRKNKPFL